MIFIALTVRPCVEKPTSDELEKFTESESPSESASNMRCHLHLSQKSDNLQIKRM